MPVAAVRAALAQARRSPVYGFRVGAAVYARDGRVITTGCAHRSSTGLRMVSSMHAELHALMRAHSRALERCGCVIVALNRADRLARSACPCVTCARALDDAGVRDVSWLERSADGATRVITAAPDAIVGTRHGRFARQQRAAVVSR